MKAITLQNNEICQCPSCGAKQEELVIDYTLTNEGANPLTSDECNECYKKFYILNLKNGTCQVSDERPV